MRCVILQPSYIPWRGHFDLIDRAELFIFYDDVQYDARGWRNRNLIKTPHGACWLTIPVHAQGAQIRKTPICDIRICWDRPWNVDHWSTIQMAYHKAPYFADFAPLLEGFYQRRDEKLADFTIDLMQELAHAIGIRTSFMRSSCLGANGAKTDRLLDLLIQVGATEYLSGPTARDYIEEDKFQEAGIRLEYMQYDYPRYPQLYPPYDPHVSILDLLFMTGPKAIRYIRNDEC